MEILPQQPAIIIVITYKPLNQSWIPEVITIRWTARVIKKAKYSTYNNDLLADFRPRDIFGSYAK